MNQSFRRDAAFCACMIYADLVSAPPQRTYEAFCYLCEAHGGGPLFDPSLPRRRPGKCDGGEVIVCPWLTAAQYAEVLPHELVHRLADTPRWASLNPYVQGWRYDRAAFIEAVARLVGAMFAAHLRH